VGQWRDSLKLGREFKPTIEMKKTKVSLPSADGPSVKAQEQAYSLRELNRNSFNSQSRENFFINRSKVN